MRQAARPPPIGAACPDSETCRLLQTLFLILGGAHAFAHLLALPVSRRCAAPVLRQHCVDLFIEGHPLGGGLEVALSAHYRIALPAAKLGLPDAGALRRKLEAGSEYMMKLPAEAFATAA